MKRLVVGLSEDLERIFALVDDEDYDRCSGYTWRFIACDNSNGSPNPGSRRYVITHLYTVENGRRKDRGLFLHRLILGVTDPKIQVHHKDNDPLNNQKINLAIMASQKEHSQQHSWSYR